MLLIRIFFFYKSVYRDIGRSKFHFNTPIELDVKKTSLPDYNYVIQILLILPIQ